MVEKTIEGVGALLLLIAAGYVLEGKNWFGAGGVAFLSKLAVGFIIPCSMFHNVWQYCGTREGLWRLLRGTPVPFLLLGTGLLIALLFAKLLRIEESSRSVFVHAVAFSNTVIVGFPIVETVFGKEALPTAMIFYMANTLLFWTVGVRLLRGRVECSPKQRVQQLLSPPLVGLLVGMVVVFFDIPVPAFALRGLSIAGSATGAVSMLFIGGVIRANGRSVLRPSKKLLSALLLRFTAIPLMGFAILRVLPLEPTTREIFFVMMTLPAMTQLGIVAKECGADYPFAAAATTLTTAVSMIVLPLFVLLLPYLH